MSMKDLMTDSVRLIKRDGRRFDAISARVDPKKIFTANDDIPVEEGDTFERDLPSGVTEKYRVVDAGFYGAIGGISAHYQSKVEKVTGLDSARSPQPQNIVYNLIGDNARINIESHDASTNMVSVQSGHFFEQLQSTISEHVQDEAAKSSLLSAVHEMETSQGTSGFLEKHREFVSLAADHMTLLAPFMPALAQLLTSAT